MSDPVIGTDSKDSMYGHIDRIATGDVGTLLDRFSDRFGSELDREIIVLRKQQQQDIRAVKPTVELVSPPTIEIEEDEIDYNGNCGKYTRTRTFVTGRWRMTLWLEDNFGELYDRDNDPQEINNLWHDPSAAEDKAELLELMLMERLKLDELSPRPKFAA